MVQRDRVSIPGSPRRQTQVQSQDEQDKIMSGQLTFKQRGKIYGLLRDKDLTGVVTFTWDNGDRIRISELTARENGMAVYLDTRSPKALPFHHASVLIDALTGLPDKNHALAVVSAGHFEQITGARPESVTDNRPVSDHWVNNVDPKAPTKAVRTPSVGDGWVKGRPTVGERPKAPTARPGLYVRNGEVFKVTESKRNPGQYVAKLIGTMDRGHRKATFVKGMVWKLTEDERMSAEQAKAYGDKFGQCVNCGKALNDPASVKLGMGPVCHKRLTGN